MTHGPRDLYDRYGGGRADRRYQPARTGENPYRRPRTAPGATTAPIQVNSKAAKRRLNWVLVTVVLLALALVGRLAFLQLADADLAARGDNQFVRRSTLPAQRGAIFDRNGADLALTGDAPTIWANPKEVKDPGQAARDLAPILDMDPTELHSRLSKNAGFVYLKRRVTPEVAAQVKTAKITGVYEVAEAQRFLPSGKLAGSVLGLVGTDNEGLTGLEYQYEKKLAGKPGLLVTERSRDGKEIPGGRRTFEPNSRGEDLVLTIDRDLQYTAEQQLAAKITEENAKGGMTVVMDTKTGEILALVNLKRDAESGEVSQADGNTALTTVYEPGSTNKLITVSAALEEGKIRPDQYMVVPDEIPIEDQVFAEHAPHGKATWSITDIVTNSSNTGTILMGQELGAETLDKYLRAYGLGTRTAIMAPGESAGILKQPNQYVPADMGSISIGQGVAVTAVQTAAAFNTVANGGVYVAPRLVRGTIGTDGKLQPQAYPEPHRVISDQNAKEMTKMLTEVVRLGTGKTAAIDGYTVAGKTGTARKPKPDAVGYIEDAYMASFVGFAPAEKPAITTLVVLDEPQHQYGGPVAGPVYASTTEAALRMLRIAPPDTPMAPTKALPADPVAAKAAAGDAGEVRDQGRRPTASVRTKREVAASAPATTKKPTSTAKKTTTSTTKKTATSSGSTKR